MRTFCPSVASGETIAEGWITGRMSGKDRTKDEAFFPDTPSDSQCRGLNLTPVTERYNLCSLHIIKEKFLRYAVPARSKTGKWLESWTAVTASAEWKKHPRCPAHLSFHRSGEVGEREKHHGVQCLWERFSVDCGHLLRQGALLHPAVLTYAEHDKNDWT